MQYERKRGVGHDDEKDDGSGAEKDEEVGVLVTDGVHGVRLRVTGPPIPILFKVGISPLR